MVNSLRRSLHTVLPRSLTFSFELTPELFNTVFLMKFNEVDVTGFIEIVSKSNNRLSTTGLINMLYCF